MIGQEQELQVAHSTTEALRAMLRTILEDRQSVPSDYGILCQYDYQLDRLELVIYKEVGLDPVARLVCD